MCGCDCCKEQDVAVASRMGRVSRNPNGAQVIPHDIVASRMGRVSRNLYNQMYKYAVPSRVPHGARE